MKTYRRHACTRAHRDTRTLARCIWPRNEWIVGHGDYASISYCHWRPTVMLHPTAEQAQHAKAAIDGGACGGRCSRRHDVVQLILSPGTATGRPLSGRHAESAA